MIKSTRQIIREVLLGANGSVDDLSSLGSDYQNAIVGIIDDACDRVCDEILLSNPYMLSTYYDLTLTGAQSYYMPSYFPFNYDSIVLIEDVTNGASDAEGSITTIWGDRMRYVEDTNDYTGRVVWSIRDQYIEFPHEQSGNVMRIWYSKKPTGLFYGPAAAGATTTSVTISSATVGQLVAETNHYVGMYLMSGTQARRITASTTAGVFTVDAFSTAPAEAAVLDLVNPLPQRYHQRIVREAVIAIRASNDDPIGDLLALSDREATTMTRRLRKSSVQGPELIRRVDR